MKNPGIQLTIKATIAIFLAVYLALINFSLPFMTNDDISTIANSAEGTVENILFHGRYSQLIATPIVMALSFNNPDTIQLTPRYISMLLLALGIILVVRKLGFSQATAIGTSAFALVTHELDWQHNGLISFFGSYNAYIALFIFGLILSKTASSNKLTFCAAVALLIGSYASELFIGLAIIYLMLEATAQEKRKSFTHSPIFWSVVLYISAYVTIRATIPPIPSNADGMANYLAGAATAYTPVEMLTAALLYFINSIPYYHKLEFPSPVSIIISALILIITASYLLVLWRRLKKVQNPTAATQREWDYWVLAAVFFVLAVAPNFLMALQPSKVDWILRNASTHYVFSYYTWIGLTIVSLYLSRQLASEIKAESTLPRLSKIVPVLLIAASLISTQKNISFANQYEESLEKWLQINRILDQNRGREIEVSPSYLAHPYITAVRADQLKSFAKLHYDSHLQICSIDNEINLSQVGSEQLAKLDGFSHVERDGRWTDGAISTITIPHPSQEINFLEIDISRVFYENERTKVMLEKDNSEYATMTNGKGKIRFNFPTTTEGNLHIKFIIEKPMSPFNLGLNSDKRNLGLKVKSLKLGNLVENGEERLPTMKSCQ